MVQVGNDFGQMAKNFGTNETLDVTGSVGAYTSTHTITGAHFKVDNVESDLAFAAYMMPDIAVPAVGVTLDATGQFGIAAHTVPLTYGKILRMGLDGMLIPMIDPAAQNLGQLIQGLVDCNQVGTLVASQIGGFGSGAITTRATSASSPVRT